MQYINTSNIIGKTILFAVIEENIKEVVLWFALAILISFEDKLYHLPLDSNTEILLSSKIIEIWNQSLHDYPFFLSIKAAFSSISEMNQ